MKWIAAVLFLVLATTGYSQDFLGKWKIVRIFTTADLEKDTDNRMMLLASQGEKVDTNIPGMIIPKDMGVEFSINPKNKAQHVTLTTGGMLLMSMNWKVRQLDIPQTEPYDVTLKIWSDDEMTYDIYSILYNDQKTLVFSDKLKAGSKFLDIYYLEKAD